MDSVEGARPCFLKAREARNLARNEGFAAPTFREVTDGLKPETPDPSNVDPGEWAHGWQYYASDAREKHFREYSYLPRLRGASAALLRAQSGRNSARVNCPSLGRCSSD